MVNLMTVTTRSQMTRVRIHISPVDTILFVLVRFTKSAIELFRSWGGDILAPYGYVKI